jgi:hypothetical protein
LEAVCSNAARTDRNNDTKSLVLDGIHNRGVIPEHGLCHPPSIERQVS